MALESEFDAAVGRAKSLPKRPSDEQLLALYALYKQATAGDVHGEEPGFFDSIARAKYDAWAQRKGMSADEARRAYVALVNELAAGG